jgi:uncharacterized protein YoaH (UPF0181 family)
MARWITWFAEHDVRGWTCSQCTWKYPAPSLLGDADAKNAFDRLARARFQEHDCSKFSAASGGAEEKSFADRVRELVTRGYKPKDAVALVLQEVSLEHRHEPKVMERAQSDADEFLRRLREGSI